MVINYNARTLKKNDDFSQSTPNPYVRKTKRQITSRLDSGTVDYCKSLSAQNGIPYHNLINFYLRACASFKKPLKRGWAA